MSKFFTFKKVAIALILITISLLLYFYLSVFMPVLLAFFTALLLEPLVKNIQKYLRFKNRLPAVAITFSLFLLFVVTSFYLIITKLVKEAIKFIDRLPYYMVEITLFFKQTIHDFNQAVAQLPPALIEEVNSQSQHVIQLVSTLSGNAIPLLAGLAQQIPSLFVIALVYLITLFLISMDLPSLKERFYSHFEDENSRKVQYMAQRIGYVFVGFFKAQFLVSVVIFIASYIGLIFITPKDALIMSVIIWIIDFIPFIGSIVILGPWALFHLVSGDTSMGIQLSILAAVLLTLRRTLEPMIMGEQIGLSALSTLLSIYLGLYFLGVVGLIAGPLSLIILKSAMEAGIIKKDFKI